MTYKTDRRTVLAGAATAGLALAGDAAGAQVRTAGTAPECYELRTYHLLDGPMKQRLDDYLERAFIPAARRAGAGPIGAFGVAIGPGSPSVHVLIPHRSLPDLVALPDRLAADPAYRQAAAAFAAAMPGDPPYVALDVKLMRAFGQFPRVEVPAAKGSRIFELRTYHSHSEQAGATKIGMFEGGGEIEIFRRTGLTPVFFAQDLTGTRLPSLTYLLTFPDLAARDRSWKAFGADPAWQRLIAMPGLAETVSGIDNMILSPMRYSQL